MLAIADGKLGSGHWRWAPLLAGAVAAGLALFKALGPTHRPPPCLFHTLTGWPCLSCGGTRCVLALTSLDLARALHYNPLIALGAIALIAAAILGIAEVTVGRPLLSPMPLLRRLNLMRAAAVVIVLANWVYLMLTLDR